MIITKHNKNDNYIKSNRTIYNRRIVAADEDEFSDDLPDADADFEYSPDVSNSPRPGSPISHSDADVDIIDDVDNIDDIEEDNVDIETDNNIANHYIAECDSCHGVFISAVTESDQIIDHISGVCPLCEKESDQLLKWIVRDVSDEDDESKVKKI